MLCRWWAVVVLSLQLLPAAVGSEQGVRQRRLFGRRKNSTTTDDKSGEGDDQFIRESTWFEEVRFSTYCYGYWNNWSFCHKRCWKVRNFTFLKNVGCPYYALSEGELDYEICDYDFCPLKRGHMQTGYMKMIRTTMFRHGLNTQKLQVLGTLFGDFQIVIQIAIISAVISIALVRHLDLDWMPDMAVAIPVAAFVAFVVRCAFYGVSFGPAMEEFFGILVSRLMNDVLLPISLFEGAYHCQQLNFYSQFGTGVFFAVFGTLLSAVLIACMVKKTGDLGLHTITSWRESFAYSAFIADVDPVATLSIFSKLKVDALLTAVVAGEATLNDPIALIMFGVCNAHSKDLQFSLGIEGLKTVMLLAGSIGVGSLLGLILTKMITILKICGKGPMETGYVFQCAFLSFVLGEALNLSGIIVSLFCGLVMGIYVDRLVQDPTSVKCFISNAARVADMIMFVMIGFCWILIDQWEGIVLGLWTILFCIIARAIMISVLVPIANIGKRLMNQKPITANVAFMMFHSGFRGGMTVMMALMLDSYWMENAYNKGTLIIATIVSVTGMCYLSGLTGPYFLRLMGVPMQVEQEDGVLQLKRSFLNRTSRIFETLVVGDNNRIMRRQTAPGGFEWSTNRTLQTPGSHPVSINSFDVQVHPSL